MTTMHVTERDIKESTAQHRILTAQELLQSDLVGMWADRQDMGETLDFARNLRHLAEQRGDYAHHD